MEKTKYYQNVKFSALIIEEAHDLFLSQLDTKKEISNPTSMSVTTGNETWNFDTRQEFLSGYPKASDCTFAHYVQGCELRIFLESEVNILPYMLNFQKGQR